MKEKRLHLRREEGSSMILALIYLLVCTLLAGSVLSAAVANRARAARMQQERQTFLLERSAMQTFAGLLTDIPALTVHDMTWEGGRRATFRIPEEGPEPSCLQELLYAHAVQQYALAEHLTPEQIKFENLTARDFSAAPETEGILELVLEYPRDGETKTVTVRAAYRLSGPGDLVISLPSMTLTAVCRKTAGTPVTVSLEDETARTVTTLWYWDSPLPGKGEGQ